MSVNFRRLTVLAIVVAALALSASATSIPDPRIIIRDPACVGSCTPVTGLTFSFTNASGISTLFFQNASGVNWNSLKLVEIGVPASAITCVSDVFVNCSATTNARGVTTLLLFGVGGSFTGLLNAHNFSIRFDCGDDPNCTGWPSTSWTATANAVPEPTSLVLVGSGIAALVSRKRLFAKRA